MPTVTAAIKHMQTGYTREQGENVVCVEVARVARFNWAGFGWTESLVRQKARAAK